MGEGGLVGIDWQFMKYMMTSSLHKKCVSALPPPQKKKKERERTHEEKMNNYAELKVNQIDILNGH